MGGDSVSDELVETIHDCTEWGGPYIRSALLLQAGQRGEQHAHSYDHATYCGSGRAEYWEDGVMVGVVEAGGAVRVRAGKPHAFVALADNTRLACIHDAKSAEEQRKF